MPARNTPASYGWVTRALHWIVALLVFGALAFGTWLAESEPSLAKIPYYAAHKTVGITILLLVLLRILWHLISPTPRLVEHGWQTIAARWTHRAFYVLLIAMPLAGYIASSATGIDTVIFNTVTLPRIAPVSEPLAETWFEIHGTIGKIIIALVVLHVTGAVIRRDGTLSRMIRGRADGENAS